MDFEKDIKINPDALDVEWLNQAELAYQYGKHWADLTDELQKAEENLKLKKSELNEEIIANKDDYFAEGVKPTIANIEAIIFQDEGYCDIMNEVNQLKHSVSIALIAKNEISNTRKAALENLVKLHGMNYFAGPSMPRNLHDEAEKEALNKKTNEKVKRSLNRKYAGI